MKFIPKIIIAIIFLSTSLLQLAVSQNHEISIGPEFGLPIGDFDINRGIGIGVSLRYEAGVGESFGIGLTAGYISFAGKSVIPIQPFFKYYINSTMDGFYFMANAGIVAGSAAGNSSFQFGFGPEFGYHFKVGDFGFG